MARRLLVLFVLLIAQNAAAQPAPKEPPADCSALEREPPTTSEKWLALARCHEKAGKTASALSAFKKAAAQAKTENAEGRVKQANEAIAALETKISKLTIQITAPVEGLEVRRDGVVLPPEERGVPVPVDPGLHRIEATAPGAAPWSTEVQIQPNGDSQLVSVPELTPRVAPAPVPESVADAPAPPPPRGAAPEEEGMSDRLIAGVSLLALGGAAIVVGAILGGLALSEASEAEDQCPDRVCPPGVSSAEIREDIRPLAEGSTMTLVMGGAAAALGITLLIIDAACDNELTVAVDPLGVRLRGRF